MDNLYIDKVLGGDTEAFRYFLKTYKDMGYNIAYSIINDEHYAEEVVQDAFMKAFNALKSFKRKSKFKTWFYRIVVNESFQRLKKIKKDQELFNSTDIDLYKNIEADDDEALGTTAVKNELKKLLPKERLAINLFYLEEYKISEIMGIAGWSKSNTKVILHRARKKLHSGLDRISNTKS